MPDNIIHICIATVAINIMIVGLLEYYGVAAIADASGEEVAAAAAKKKDDDYVDADATDAEGEAEADDTSCREIIYEINMSDMIDIILDKLQERVEIHNVQHLRETLLAAYCAMNTSPIDVDIIDTVVDMVLLCIRQINAGTVVAEAATEAATKAATEAEQTDE